MKAKKVMMITQNLKAQIKASLKVINAGSNVLFETSQVKNFEYIQKIIL